MKLRLFSIVPVLAALTGGCSPSFEADLPDVEITQHGLKMTGVPGAAQVGDTSVSSSFTLSPSTWAKRMNSEIFVHRATITASDSLANLDFIKSARVTAAVSALAEGTTPIMDYEAERGCAIHFGHRSQSAGTYRRNQTLVCRPVGHRTASSRTVARTGLDRRRKPESLGQHHVQVLARSVLEDLSCRSSVVPRVSKLED